MQKKPACTVTANLRDQIDVKMGRKNMVSYREAFESRLAGVARAWRIPRDDASALQAAYY